MKVLLSVSDETKSHWEKAKNALCLKHLTLLAPDSQDVQNNQIKYAILEPHDEQIDAVLKITSIEYLISVWAGVDVYVRRAKDLKGKKVIRAIGKSMQTSMIHYITTMSMALVLDLYGMREQQQQQKWLPRGRRDLACYQVTVLGLGKMGLAVAKELKNLGFQVRGYARRKRQMEGISCFAEQELLQAVKGSNLVICLLPLNSMTRGILSEQLFDKMAQESFLINVGRGAHVDKPALLKALNGGKLQRAVLDVFEEEPLPTSDVYWYRDDVILTPHIAATTYAEDALGEAETIIKKIEQCLQDRPLETILGDNIVLDIERGY